MAQLRKDGNEKIICSANKQKGKKSEVCPFEIEDMVKLIEYFKDNHMWLYYMMFVLSCNLARRVGDMLSLKWENFFNPSTGTIRSNILEIQEEKTDKLANPRINSACRAAIKIYVDETGCDVSKDRYTVPVFMQLSGNYRGTVLSDSGYLKALKRAASSVGIDYNVGTHSPRKTFGKMSRMLHPSDYDSMELLQTIYNHSDTKTTKRYIGLTKEKVDTYYDDMGNFFDEYVVAGKPYAVADKPIVSIDSDDLRDIIRAAYQSGLQNAGNSDAMAHVDAINDIMQMVEGMVK